MKKDLGLTIFLFIVALSAVFLFTLTPTRDTPEDYSQIAIDMEMLAKDLNRDFLGVCYDNEENIYLHALSITERDNYIIKFNKKGEQVAWFRFEAGYNVNFGINPETGVMAFNPTKKGEVYLYDSNGTLIDLSYDPQSIINSGEFIGLENEVKSITLSDQSTFEIVFENGLFSLELEDIQGNHAVLY